MSPLLFGLIGVLLVPLFVASWRVSLFGLCCQGLLLAWLRYRLDPSLDDAEAWIDLVEFGLVRGVAAPLALYTVLRAQHVPARNDVLPPNLMWWTLAIGLVLVAFRCADLLVTVEGDAQTLVAVAAAALLLGLLVLATQVGPFSQMVGALRVENAIALFSLGGPHAAPDLPLALAQTALVVATIALFRWYLRTLPRAEAPRRRAVDGARP